MASVARRALVMKANGLIQSIIFPFSNDLHFLGPLLGSLLASDLHLRIARKGWCFPFPSRNELDVESSHEARGCPRGSCVLAAGSSAALRKC